MADDNSYHRLLAEYRKRDNYAEVFRTALDEMAADQVDFGRVRSCIAFGTGAGEREIEFVRRLMPNVRAFTAVEPDPESVRALRDGFQRGRLPGVETAVVESTLENWSGVDSAPVDAVLLISVLAGVHSADRRALFHQLATRHLSPGGTVVIVDNVCSVPSGFLLVLQRLGMPRDDYVTMEKEMLDCGFRVVLSRDLRITRDLSNPSEDVVKFIALLTDYKHTEREVRAAIDDVYSRPNMDVCVKKLAIFTK